MSDLLKTEDGPGDQPTPQIVLASGSAARRRILEQAGIAFRVAPAAIDERALEAAWMHAHPALDMGELAIALATAKAHHVARTHPQAIVIGADQVLSFQGRPLHKAASPAVLRDQLIRLRGERHTLFSAAVIVHRGETTWSCVDRAELSMRRFSPGFLETYIVAAGERVLGSVGGYQLEGLGAQLFEHVEGDHFTVLGLPLLPLLAELRQMNAIAS